MPVYSSLIQWVGSLGFVQLGGSSAAFLCACLCGHTWRVAWGWKVWDGLTHKSGSWQAGVPAFSFVWLPQRASMDSFLWWLQGCQEKQKRAGKPQCSTIFQVSSLSCLLMFYWPQKVIWSSPDPKHTELESIC